MKCEEIDLLEYIEGMSPRNVVAHIEICKKCQRESERLTKFSRLASTRYFEEKKVEQELESRLKSIDCSKMERLPVNLQKKVAEMKEERLASRIRKAIGKTIEREEQFVASLMRPRLQVMPASPKDITKAKKRPTKKKKRVTKKLKKQ